MKFAKLSCVSKLKIVFIVYICEIKQEFINMKNYIFKMILKFYFSDSKNII